MTRSNSELAYLSPAEAADLIKNATTPVSAGVAGSFLFLTIRSGAR